MARATGDEDEVAQNAEMFRVLGHETRLRLLMLLASGEQNVGAIDTLSGIGQPALSQQLGVLRKAGLVDTRRVAKQIYYSVEPQALRRVAEFLAQLTGGAGVASPARRAPDAVGAADRPGQASRFARML